MKPLKDNPCKDCVAPKRHAGCHGKCPDYIIAAAFHEADRRAEFEKREVAQYSIDKHRDNSDALYKRKRGFRGHNWRHS